VQSQSDPRTSVTVFGQFVDLNGPARTELVARDAYRRSTPYDPKTDQIRPARQSFPCDLYAGANGTKIEQTINRAPVVWRQNLYALKRGLDAFLNARLGATPVKPHRGYWHAGGLTIEVTPLFALALPDGRVEVVIPWWTKGRPPGPGACNAVHRITRMVMDEVYPGGTPVLLDFHRGGRAFDRLVGPASPRLDQWLTAEAFGFTASVPADLQSAA
jgi:hypothetical protein